MEIVYSTPVLQSKTRTGKEKFWQGHLLTDGSGGWSTQSSYWQTNNDGTSSAVQYSEPFAVEPKNVGRSNETTAEQQAYLEIERDFKKQKDKGYAEIGQESEVLPLPMLAHKFSDRGHKVTWPAYVQPKLNGQRMLFDGEKGWSRGGKLIISECIAHIGEELGPLPEGMILDGELILPGNPLLQKTMTAIKKFRPELSPTLVYWIYDIVDPTRTFSERFDIITEFLVSRGEDLPLHIKVTPTITVESPSEVLLYHSQFVEQGFEGSMVRFDSEGYDIGHRNNQLQKVKDFVDAEFEVLDIVEGGGRFKGAAIFVCRATETETFTCVMEGDMDYRRSLFTDRDAILKQKPYLTVRYQELSKDGVPIFPVGVILRETKDGGF
jgi:ATP-dependent DNA ligase